MLYVLQVIKQKHTLLTLTILHFVRLWGFIQNWRWDFLWNVDAMLLL